MGPFSVAGGEWRMVGGEWDSDSASERIVTARVVYDHDHDHDLHQYPWTLANNQPS